MRDHLSADQLGRSGSYWKRGDPLRFSYPADHPFAAEFEERMTALVREYKGDGEYLSVHHPDTPGALDDAPDATALMLMGGAVGDILFV
ncbi:MAG: hypothetical protein ACKVP0_12495 [Pirellulaceae bacterium]